MQAKIHRRAGTTRGGDFAVCDHSILAEDFMQFARHRVVRGVAAPGEQTAIVEHGRCRADRREPAPFPMMAENYFADPRISAQLLHSGTAGEKNEIEQFRLHGAERDIAVDRDAAASGGVPVFGERRDRHLDASAAQQVHRCEGFNLLKLFRQDNEHGWHDGIEASLVPIGDQEFCSCDCRPAPALSLAMALAGKRLVILGCGYVGRALAHEAQRAGLIVTALTRNPAKAEALRVVGVDVVVGELSSNEWHAAITAAPDFVVNCVSSGGGGPEDYRRSYVEGMRSVLAWLVSLRRPIESFVYTSSTSVYPQGDGAVVDESSPTGDGPFNGRILVESENLLRAAPPSVVRRSFILRLAGIYGPGRHYLLNQLRAGSATITGDPAHRMNLIHRDDIVAAILACLTAPAPVANSIFNVTDGAPAPKGDVMHWLANQLGVPTPAFASPSGSARRDGNPVPDRVINSSKIQRELGWHPRFADYRAGYADILRPGEPRF